MAQQFKELAGNSLRFAQQGIFGVRARNVSPEKEVERRIA
jgi:hypothetical protein